MIKQTLTFFALCLLAVLSVVLAETIGHVTRDYFGDIFTLGDCSPGSCDSDGRRAAQIPGERCRCQCAPSHYTFREDVRQCVKDVGECPVAMFIRPFAVERIPLVFLPFSGQLVYPGAHLTVSGIARTTPSRHHCNVKTSLLMTSHGWLPIKSHIFGVYYDGNKTFLQWLGDDEDRRRLQHHLVLIRLICDEVSNGTFEPCAALRIGFSPGLEPQAGIESSNKKNNYITVGLCLGILGLIYVGAVIIYLKVRKGRRRASRQGLNSSQGTLESGDMDERANPEVRSAYINNLVQEAELTSHKSSSKGASKIPECVSGSNPAENQQVAEIKEAASAGSPNGKLKDNYATVHHESQNDAHYCAKKKDDEQSYSKRESVSAGGRGYISRRHLLHKLEEEEVDVHSENGIKKYAQNSRSTRGSAVEQKQIDDSVGKGWSLSQNEDSTPDESNNLKTRHSSSGSQSVRTSGNQDMPSLSKSKKKSAKSIDRRRHRDAEDVSDGSEVTEASLSGDSLNSSFRKPSKSPSSIKSKASHVSMEEMSVLSASSMITASTAIKEIDDYDFEGDEEDDLSEITQDDDSRMSTDLDPEDFSLDESEHPSLEEYLQLSSQVAKKLSERTVPAFSSASQREKNVLAQFMKDFKTTLGRLRAAEDAKPKANRSISPGADNWTLKREDKRAKVSRKVSIFKRNPLKARRNDEPLVSGDESLCKNDHYTYDINIASETDDTVSCNSSTASSLSGKGGKSKYKNKPPEIVPAAKGGEKTIIAISNESPQKRSSPEIREVTKMSPKYVMGGGSKARTAKAVSPPLPPPKPKFDKLKVKIDNAANKSNTRDDPNCLVYQNDTTQIAVGKASGQTKAFVASKSISKELSEVANRYLRSPSIESDSISIANSDMTEDSLNTPISKGISDDENQDEISEDENGAIDRCLAQLADSVIQPPDDCSLNRYLSQLGTVLAARDDNALDQCLNKLASNMNANRATKGFNVSQHLPLGSWEHICVDRSSDRSTPTSERSSTSRGSRSSQENLRKKTLSKSKHHHHHHHRPGECKLATNGDGLHGTDHQDCHQGNHMSNGPVPTQTVDVDESYTTRILVEKSARKDCNSGCPRVTSTSEDEDSHASSHSSNKNKHLSETNSDPSSTDFDKPRKKRPVVRRSKKGLNGTCRQHIQNNRNGKGDRASIKKNNSPCRSSSTPRSTSSDVTVIQLEGEPMNHVKNVETSNTFVTLINVDSSDCSNSAEEK